MKNLILIFIFLLSISSPAQVKKQTNKKKLVDFSLHFYRLRIDPTIIVKKVIKKDHFFVAEGETKNSKALMDLSRKLLFSKTLSKFRIIDSLVHQDGDNFKLYMKTENKLVNQGRPWVSVNPISRYSPLENNEISGNCYPSDRRIKFTGDFNGFSKCKKGAWSLKIPSMTTFPSFIFAYISNAKGNVYIDGVSFNAENFPK